MRFIRTFIFLFSAVFFVSALRAQQVYAYLGLGTVRADSTDQSTFGDGNLYSTPALGGVFTDVGAGVFFNRQFGVGWTLSWRAAHDYAGLQYRPQFNNFDAIFQPAGLRMKRAVPEFRAGIGFASVHFDYDDPTSCAHVPGCPSSHHFLAHAGAPTRLYLTNHLFLRPALDLQYVDRFFPFGSNWVPRYSMSLGYSFGRL